MGNVWYVIILCIGILYVLSPIDVVPDVVPILGWVEDLLVFAVALWLANRMRKSEPTDAASERDDASRRGQANGDTLREPPASAPTTPWQLLGIEPSASSDVIEAAYKAKLMQYHPDRVAHLGEELQGSSQSRHLSGLTSLHIFRPSQGQPGLANLIITIE